MITTNPFRCHGHLDPKKDSMVYIERKKEEKHVLDGIQKDLNYYAITAPRQTGKTTFMQQLINKINEDEFHRRETIYITLEDLTGVEKGEFYSNMARKIISCLRNKYSIQPESLLTIYKNVSSNLDFEDFLIELSNASLCAKTGDNEILFHSERQKIHKYVIFIDEIDCMPKEIALEFIKTIRAIFSQRSFIKGYDNYSFIISGAVDLAKLTLGKTSPYNIAEQIDLRDFEEEEVISMTEAALQEIGAGFYGSFPKELFKATNGHPCLTQKLCAKIIDDLMSTNRDAIQEDDLTRHIDGLIESGDITLKTTWEKVKDTENLEILQRIMRDEEIKYNEFDEFSYELKLSGAIGNNHGLCKIRNSIYREFFSKQFGIE